MAEPSPEQIKHNQSLWHWYPLGQVDAMWTLMEHLASSVGREKYVKEIDAIFGALQDLDTKVRAERYPLLKKKVKQSNGILQRAAKRRTRKTL